MLKLVGVLAWIWWNAGVVAATAQPSSTAPAGDGYELTPTHPTAEQTFASEPVSPTSQTFVQLEITQLENPNRVPLSLTVEFESPQRGRIYLGSFNVGPGDNPGKFLVATQGTLQAGGKMRVTLLPLRSVSDNEGVRLRLRPLSLTTR